MALFLGVIFMLFFWLWVCPFVVALGVFMHKKLKNMIPTNTHLNKNKEQKT
jgi:hypothetical protein